MYVFWNQRRFSVLTHELKVNHRDAKNATNKAENICAEAEKKKKKMRLKVSSKLAKQ